MSPATTFDNPNTTSKENMRREIRHALTQKSTSKFPNIDIHAEVFDIFENMLTEFAHNFRSAGGKVIACNRENFADILYKIIVGQRFTTILNTNHSIAPALTQKNLNYITCMDNHQQADVAIIYADVLIARTGSVLFTQKYSLYPSIRNTAKDIIVVAFEKSLVLDLKDAFLFQQEKNQGSLYDFVEIITPTKPATDKSKEDYSPLEPRFILLLIQ
jgi:L-lactate utilization protein LutC